MSKRALEAIDRIVTRSGDADDVLRAVVGVLVDEPGIAWAGIAFLEDGAFVRGPAAGVEDDRRRVRVPVSYDGGEVAELRVDGIADEAFLERVAAVISAHCLVGWATGGIPWETA